MLNRVSYQGTRVVVHRRGKDVGALVSMDDLALLERLEDEIDIAATKDALADPENQQPIPWPVARKMLAQAE